MTMSRPGFRMLLCSLLGVLLGLVVITAAQEDDRPSLPAAQARRAATLIMARCAVCHTTDLISQQRLPEERWIATVEKMVHWGAELSKEESGLVLQYLIARNHPGAPDELPTIEQELAKSVSAAGTQPTNEGPLTGMPARGAGLYAHNCQACHGEGASGGVGPKLARNLILKNEGAFWETVLHGRGPMPAWGAVLSHQDIADIHAWLATR
ncbi:MAG TPA: c-type cytochrome [Nitrospira sp.]|nr:c-type cytochrome [Nitrospira sp.]HNA27340.1 c-type cytochrome [Nitrospira sp.]HNI69288.1 c-type cytochrome [Nitrospira sp.]HNK16708.1 c-type cytochrome [Nitrospira sp.]HNL89825.1 c-type cytochrome [Nitrospira sp.]